MQRWRGQYIVDAVCVNIGPSRLHLGICHDASQIGAGVYGLLVYISHGLWRTKSRDMHWQSKCFS